jgi:serine/threonine protein kinase/tetratricopeptide (TPR) repeat protein
MADVYRARDIRLGRELAIKILPSGMAKDKERLSRFEKEARLASALNHPNIITVYDIGWADSIPYIALELVDGITLRERLAQGPVPVTEIAGLASQIADGLAKAHEAGVVHRDLKPENVMITKDGLAKILDFGLGKYLAPLPVDDKGSTVLNMGDSTTPGAILGTVEYMSPEQAAGKEADFRGDQFSFGSLLYEMVTNAKPFHRDSAVQTLAAIIESTPRPMDAFDKGLPESFRKIIERCLQKNPDQRFSSTRELAAALREQSILISVAGRGVTAPPVAQSSSARKLWPWIAGVAAILAVIIISAGLSDSVRRLVIPSHNRAAGIPDKENVAILPFQAEGQQNLTAQIFADGLTESVTEKLTRLTILPSLQIAPASEVRSRQIQTAENARKAVGANLIVTGNIQELDGRFRVTTNLVDTASERQLDTRTISASATDALSLQDQLVAAIVEMLGLKVNPAERAALTARDTRIAAAKEAFLQARGYFQNYDRPENVDHAIALLEEALRLDPIYAAAAAAEGEAHWRKFESTKDPKWIEAATNDCQRAIRADDKLPAAHSCLGNVYRTTGRYPEGAAEFQRAVAIEPTNDDFYRELAHTQQFFSKAEAEETFKQAITLRPHYWANYNRLGIYYHDLARYDDAVRMFQQVIALAPDCLYGYGNLGAAYIELGRYTDAIPVLEKATAMRPTAVAFSNLGMAYYGSRRFLESVQTFEQAATLNDKNHIIWGNLGDAYYWAPGKRSLASGAYDRAIPLAKEQLKVNPRDAGVLAQLASYYAMEGDKETAQMRIQSALLIAPEDAEVLYKAAIIYNQFKDLNKTFEWLEKAVVAGYSRPTIKNAPNFDSLWGEPRFRKLIDPN